ncbi:hypothetical protein ACWD5R_45370 [Streptomyces sp. NPDC002514]|uniref:hypothetical protein n=1 Tax=Streptomyces sp. NPDC001270 TaxID=3364554 RepID=UPI00369914B9
MKRLLHATGVVVATTVLCLTAVTNAVAANGALIVNGATYVEPHGCFDSEGVPFDVDNQANAIAHVFDAPGCQGGEVGTVPPGESRSFGYGSSVFID